MCSSSSSSKFHFCSTERRTMLLLLHHVRINEKKNTETGSDANVQHIFLFTDQNLNLVQNEEFGRLPCFILSSMSGSIDWNE